MVVISYSAEEHKKEYLKRNLELAKKTLTELPNLNKLLNNFKGFESYTKINNSFFWVCSYPLRNPSFGDPSATMQELRDFDNLLGSIKINSELINKARMNNYEQSQSLYSELKFFNYLKKKYGRGFTLYPKINGKNPEGLLKINSQEIYLEQTSFMGGETSKKLEEVFEKIAEKICSLLDKNTLISMHIDANKIKWEADGRIDIEEASKHLWDSIHHINLTPFFNIRNSDVKNLEWNIHAFNNIGTGRLIDHITYLDGYSDMGLFLAENQNKEPSKSFLNNNVTDLQGCPVESFFSVEANYPLVQIQTNLLFPSESAHSEFKSIKQRINAKIKSKIKQNQFPDGKTNLLLIEADIWMLFDYEWKEDPQIKELIQSINLVLNEVKDTKISSIVIYARDLSRRLIISNPYATIKISEEEVNKIL